MNHNKLLKLRQSLGFIFTKITWKMSENYCFHLENKQLSAKAWQRYAFFNLSWVCNFPQKIWQMACLNKWLHRRRFAQWLVCYSYGVLQLQRSKDSTLWWHTNELTNIYYAPETYVVPLKTLQGCIKPWRWRFIEVVHADISRSGLNFCCQVLLYSR